MKKRKIFIPILVIIGVFHLIKTALLKIFSMLLIIMLLIQPQLNKALYNNYSGVIEFPGNTFISARITNLHLFDDVYLYDLDPSLNTMIDHPVPGSMYFETIILPYFENYEETNIVVEYNINDDFESLLDENTSFVWTLQVGNEPETTYQNFSDLIYNIEDITLSPEIESISIGWKWDIDGPYNDNANDVLDNEISNVLYKFYKMEFTVFIYGEYLVSEDFPVGDDVVNFG